jgi:hypothetical protein
VDVLTSAERVLPNDRRRAALGSVGIAAAWAVLALWRPGVTFHLAPFLVAGAWPFLLRNGPLRVADRDALRAAVSGFALTMLTSVVLVAADAMRGPTLWDGGHAMLEVVPIAAVGAVTGYRFARCGVAAES